jgi:hypothetical protein
MKILEALVSELKRLESISDEQWNEEMLSNSELGILLFAAKSEIEDIIYGSLRAPVYRGDVSPERVDAIIQKVLPQ